MHQKDPQDLKDLESMKENACDEGMCEKTESESATSESSEPVGFIKQIETLRQKLDNAEKKSKESQDRALYALAELENIKRRAQVDVEQAHKFGLEKCLSQLIPVIDSLDQAISTMEKTEIAPAIKQGIEMTLKMFSDTLGKFGVERLDPKGLPFDPAVHEAMSMQPIEGVAANTVTLVYQRGYRLNGRLVRPARVIVAS